MKIIIYGTSETAYLVANELFEEHDITIINNQDELPDDFNKLDLSFVEGNATNIKTLKAAGICDADLFISCTDLDEANIVASWSAKKTNPDIQNVCFVSKYEYIENFKENNDENSIDAGIDHIIWPEEILTQEVFRIITVPEAIDVEDFEGGKARLLEYRIKENSIIADKLVKDCYFPENCLIVGITRDSELFIPDGSTILQTGDKVIFMGCEVALGNLAKDFFEESKKPQTVTIIGGGNVGYMLAEHLETIDIKTKIIEKNYDRCEYLTESLNSLVLNGDGTNLELLESENIGDCDVVVSVTNNDEKNLLCSLLAKQLGVRKVITRVNKPTNVELFEKVGIDVAVSPNEAAIQEIRNKFIITDVNILATVERGQGEVLEIEVGNKFSDVELMKIELPAKAIIGTIKRGNKVIIPKGNTLIREDDTLIIFTTGEDAQKIKEFFKK